MDYDIAVLARQELQFHEYDRVAPSPHIEDLLQKMAHDPTAISWG
jgi:hypothetical protein